MAHVGAELTQFQKLHQFYSCADTASPFLNSVKVGCYGPAGEVSWPRALGFLVQHLAAWN
jgi:hypothetical protein